MGWGVGGTYCHWHFSYWGFSFNGIIFVHC